MARKHKMLGEVNLLGLDNFGDPAGMKSIYGVAIGGGVTALTTLASRHSSNASIAGNAEAIGLGTGLAVSGVMYAMKATRHAALASALTTFFTSGVAWLERKLFGTITVTPTAPIPAPAAGTSGMGLPTIRGTSGMGLPTIRGLDIPQARTLNGLGIPQISARTALAGTIPGVAGNQLAAPGLSAPPVSLLGPRTPQAAHLLGMGGPGVHGLAAAYGATLLGGGR